MNNRIDIRYCAALALTAALCAPAHADVVSWLKKLRPPADSTAEQKKMIDEWRVRENLVGRLESEWERVQALFHELASVADVLNDIRNIELFPAGITHMDEQSLVKFDKEIEKLDKDRLAVLGRLDALSMPLSDAASILREMVAGRPVEEMFAAIEQGNVSRITEMLSVKHSIDSLWHGTDDLLAFVVSKSGVQIARQRTVAGRQDEFLEIIRSNLGLAWQDYYERLAMIKDSLAGRATRSQIDEMYIVEMNQIRGYVDKNDYLLATQKLSPLIGRFESRCPIDELYLLLARAQFGSGDYAAALSTLNRVPDAPENASVKVLLALQARFMLRQYDEIWKWSQTFDFKRLKGADLNLALWVTLESGLVLGETERLARLASLSAADAPYVLHVLHALGRSFVAVKDYATALSVFERALRKRPAGDADREACARIQLSAAQTQYELGRYEKALGLFFPMVNDPRHYDEALSGVVWCYINLGLFDKADMTMRTLINQAPSSPRAAGAILIMAERSVSKAGYEWKKTVALTKEERRLRELLDRINEKRGADSVAARRVDSAAAEVSAMLSQVRGQDRDGYRQLAGYYDRAVGACDLIASYYRTGSFQEISFTHKREKLLHQLDSLVMAIQAGPNAPRQEQKLFAEERQAIDAVKSVVKRSDLFSVETQINRYRWEREYLDWEKENVNYADQALARTEKLAPDSAARATAHAQRTLCAARIDSLVRRGDQVRRQWHSRLTAACTALLATRLDPADDQYVRYHLAELHYISENADYLEQYSRFEAAQTAYEERLAQYRSGAIVQMPEAPQRPELSHEASIREFRQVVALEQDPAVSAAAQYCLAWCYSDLGRSDSALSHMSIVADQFPESQYAPQAYMYIGESAFDGGKLAEAAQAYQEVMKYPESQWFDEALYKYAWTQYRMSNPQKAISSFLALVDLGQKGALGTGLLEKESMEYIAISFSEADMTGEKGLSRAARFIDRFGDLEKGAAILIRLAGVYKDQGRFDMAEKTYRKFLSLFPTYGKAPEVERELLSVLEKSMPPDEANRARMALYRKYSRTGAWARAQADSAARAQGDSIAAGALYDAAIGQHQLALQKNDRVLYKTAASEYEEYIKAFPRLPDANECHYNLAEIMFSLGDYSRAAEEYIAVSRRYPGSKFQETAAWNAIVASQNLLKAEGGRQ